MAAEVRLRQLLLFQPHGGEGRSRHVFAVRFQHAGAAVAQAPAHREALFRARFIGNIQLNALFRSGAACVDVPPLREHALLAAGEQHRREEALFKIVQRFPAAEIVDGGPGGDGPAVVELPHDGSHAAAAEAPPVLHRVAHGLRLHELRGVDKQRQACRIAEIVREICHHLGVAAAAFLVALHHVGEGIAILRLGERFDRLHRGHRFKAEFGRIAEQVAAVFRERPEAVPHLPVMRVAACFVLRQVKVAAGGRAGRPVEGVWVLAAQNFGDHIAVHARVIALELRCFAVAVIEKAFHFIVPAPERQAGVVADAPRVFLDLARDVCFKRFRQAVGGAGEHEVLPHQQAQLVAGIVEGVLRVVAAAPHAHRVEMGQRGLLQQMACPRRCDAAEQAVLRDVIGAHGEHAHAVDLVGEAFAPLVARAVHAHGAQADALLPHIRRFTCAEQFHAHRVERLCAIAARPPQLRVLHLHLAGGAFPALRIAVRAGHRHAPAVRGAFRVQAEGEKHAAVLVALAHKHIREAGGVDAQKRHGARQAHVRQAGAPVPAEHAA